jgi:hypothetical protein
VNQPNGCRGGHCYQHRSGGVIVTCSLYYTFYATGCWTSANTDGRGGYWTCCDCECFNSSGTRVAACGCAQLSVDPWKGID